MVVEIELTRTGNNKRKNGSWTLFRDDVDLENSENPEGGETADLLDENEGYRGRGFYSDRGPIAVHVISNSKVSVNKSFFKDRIKNALRTRRKRYEGFRSYRMVNGQGDYLPGLIVDRYGEFLSFQIRSQAMARHREIIVEVLEELVDPQAMIARNDVPVRDRLGLDRTVQVLHGKRIPDRIMIQKDPYSLVADLKNGQKTGFYLDQEVNRRRLRSVHEPGRCLDCFCYSGAWGMALLHAGADSVVFVDRSREALRLVEENAKLNDWQDRIKTIKEDGFDYLANALDEDHSFDSVVLDPPAFAKSHDQLRSARKGYKGINLRAMRLLKPLGFLATSSCSSPVDMNTFSQIIRDSAHDAHVSFQVLERRFQSPDHPWLTNYESSRYLTCVMGNVSLV